jgi:hypothetical protein
MDEQTRHKRYEKKPEVIEIKASKSSSEWVMDEKGYFLIDPRPEEGIFFAHHYSADGVYNKSVSGIDAEEIYYTLLREDLVGSLQHAAYLGSELQKATIVVKFKLPWYKQDDPLVLTDPRKKE